MKFYASDLEELTSRGIAYTKAPVFYNPRMKLNRDTAVLTFKALSLRTGADLMAASGVRALRLAVEGGGEVVANDRNYLSCHVIRMNVRLNGLQDRISVTCKDARLRAEELSLEGRVDYLDLDPFGSPAPYVDPFLRAVRRRGVLAVTATDTPPLFGKYPDKLLRYYGIRGFKVPFFREFGIRALISFVLRQAGRLDLYVEPLLSYTTAHYIRVLFLVNRGPSTASKMINELGWIRADGFRVEVLDNPCEKCLGPIWLGDLSNPEVLDKLLTYSSGEVKELISKLRDEVGMPPYYYPLDEIASKYKVKMPSVKEVIERLKDLGYKASRFHGDPVAIKTDAPTEELLTLIKRLS